MTAEALSFALCLASGIFGRPAWTVEKCDERAIQISEIAKQHDVDPLLMVAVNIQECDMREDVDALVTVGEGRHKRVVGIDACPMGVRIMGPAGVRLHAALHDDNQVAARVALYDTAARAMVRWKRWCSRGHQGNAPLPLFSTQHHFIAHYNQGDPTYSHQVLGIQAALARRPIKPEHERRFTERTKEIVRRLLLAQRKAEKRRS